MTAASAGPVAESPAKSPFGSMSHALSRYSKAVLDRLSEIIMFHFVQHNVEMHAEGGFIVLVAAFRTLKAAVSGCFWVQRLPS